MEFFGAYLFQIFNINHSSIIQRWLAVLPIVAYLSYRKRSGYEWKIRKIGGDFSKIHQYFILSQFCDWNTQTMINAFTQIAIMAGKTGVPFPLEEIRDIAVQKGRFGFVQYDQFTTGQRWLALKILMPDRSYVFDDNKPEIDHIFPMNLKGKDEKYQRVVDTIWNFQPIPSEINGYKRAKHPIEFFTSEEGRKYFEKYDFVPPLESGLWRDERRFIWHRQLAMRRFLLRRYHVKLEPPRTKRKFG